MIDCWEKNFGVIARPLDPSRLKTFLRDAENLRNRDIENLRNARNDDRVFGHAVMVLKIDDKLYYRGYRPILEGRELRKALAKNKDAKITDIFREGVDAEIRDEKNMYHLRHKKMMTETTSDEFVYQDWDCAEDEVHSILRCVIKDEKKEKVYSLDPDTARKNRNVHEDKLVHNCVTWIVETEHTSVNNPLLPQVENGNIARFIHKLQNIGNNV